MYAYILGGFFLIQKGVWPYRHLKSSPGDTDSKYMWVCGSNFKRESRICIQMDR